MQQDPSLRLIVELRVKGPLPSLNELLGMHHLTIHKLKRKIQDDFLSALRTSARDSLTKTTVSENSIQTACATLACYLQMHRVPLASRRANAKLLKLSQSTSESSSSK